MSVRVFDATCYVADDDSLQSSSVDYHTLICSGDTIRVSSQRNPAYNDTGHAGEICFNANYLFYCYENNKWGRIPFEKNYS